MVATASTEAAGNDTLLGRRRQDTLRGGPGATSSSCGAGRDVAYADGRTASAKTAKPPRGSSAPVVLLVDDDARIRRAVGTGLTLEGFEVVPASGGRAALEAIARICRR